MGILFFDTETTGLVNSKLPSNDPSQPHIVQAAAVLADANGRELATVSSLIKPKGWTIQPGAEAVHGISVADCERWGLPIEVILPLMNQLALRATRIVAHNIAFDSKVLDAEYARLNRPECPFATHGPTRDLFCTMKASTGICRLPSKRGYKWPKLVEAHQYFFNAPFDGAHDALADVRACMRVYFELVRRKTEAGPVEVTEESLF